MRHELWTAILDTTAALDRIVAAEVGDLPNRGPAVGPELGAVRTSAPLLETAWRGLEASAPDQTGPGFVPRPITRVDERDRSSLATLRVQVGARVDLLWTALEGEQGFDRIRRALVIYFDERVMSVVPEYLRLSWPLLQTELTHSTMGGVDFYRFIDDALDDPRTPSLVFEVHYFCLRHGFRGRYTNELGQINATLRRLLDRIDLPEPVAQAQARGGTDTLGTLWPLWAYYAVALVFVLGFCLALTVWSNQGANEDAAGPVSEGAIGRRSS